MKGIVLAGGSGTRLYPRGFHSFDKEAIVFTKKVKSYWRKEKNQPLRLLG